MACLADHDEPQYSEILPMVPSSKKPAAAGLDVVMDGSKAPETVANNHTRHERHQVAPQEATSEPCCSQRGEQESLCAEVVLIEAWTEKSFSTTPHATDDFMTPPVKFPGIVWQHGNSSPTRLLTRKGLGREKKISCGSHAFVLMPGESGLRVAIMAYPFGEAAGHPGLGQEEPVVFAGEFEVNEEGQLVRWNNMSGTYKSPESLAHQAGLPMDKFYAVRPRLPSAVAAGPQPPCLSCGGSIHVSNDESDEDTDVVQCSWVHTEYHSLLNCACKL